MNHRNLKHQDVSASLADYLEGDLAIEKRALVDAHLERCAECSSEVDEMRSTISLLRGLPDVEAPRTLAADVMRRIRNGEAQPGLLDRMATWLDELTTPRVMVPVATLAAGLAIGLVTSQVQNPQPWHAPEAPSQLAAVDPAPADTGAPVVAEVELAEVRPVRRPTLRQPHPRLTPNRTAVREFPLLTMQAAEPRISGGPDGSQPVANFVMAQQGGRAQNGADSAPASSDPAEREARRARVLDARLDDILSAPERFEREFAEFDALEQELWMKLLAERAGERGDADRVLLALQADEGAGPLASAFEQALATLDAAGGE